MPQHHRLSGSVVAFTLAAALGVAGAAGQPAETLPEALAQMVETERAFAARTRDAGWRQASIEYFADSQVWLTTDQAPTGADSSNNLDRLWEPRYGDIASGGDLGYLTGPVQHAVPPGTHAIYTRIWKRQRDGAFKVVMDVTVDIPRPAPFPPGFTRAPSAGRFTGDYDDTTPPLRATDEVLNSALRSGQARAYRDRLAAGARLHRPNLLPLVGESSISRWLAAQPPFSSGNTLYTETSRSGDLGYTWGTYRTDRQGAAAARQGRYLRVWTRERSGQWKIALDVLQPQ